MLLSSVNSIDYALDIVTNNKKNETDMDKSTYKNLNQDENIEEVSNSTAINFNNDLTESSQNDNNNENVYIKPPRRRKKKCTLDIVFTYATNFLKFCGPLFCITIITFLIYTYISILKNIFPYWYKYFISYENHKIFYNIIKYLISFELFLTIINDLLAIIIKPGSVFDLKNSKYYKAHSAYYSDELKIPDCFNKNNYLKKDFTWKICKYCHEVKPLRTHHCSLCGICVLKMDHHCPWINNCIGQNNQRYFLLFLFHSFCYTFIGTLLTLPILFTYKKYSDGSTTEVIISKNNLNMKEIKYICVLGIISLIVESFFSGWNWFLALNGYTTLEFWADKTNFEIDGGIRNFSFGHWKKNLFYIFGTENIIKLLFLPNFRKLPFSGLEFSRYVDKNFFVDGI